MPTESKRRRKKAAQKSNRPGEIHATAGKRGAASGGGDPARRASQDAIAITAQATIEAAENGSGTFEGTLYNGGILRVYGYANGIVIDLAGLQINGRVPILATHSTWSFEQVLGDAAATIEEGRRVKVKGAVVPGTSEADRLLALARAGVQTNMSIGAAPLKIERIAAGEKATANGQTFTGPIDIARAARLLEGSFVPIGADAEARARIAARHTDTETNPMDFETWLKAKGFDPATITAQQREYLEAQHADETKEATEPVTAASTGSSTGARENSKATIDDLRAREVAETKRVADIRRICAGKHSAIEARAIQEGWDADRTELHILRAARPEQTGVRGSGAELPPRAFEAALCRSAGVSQKIIEASFTTRELEAADRPELRDFGIEALFRETIRMAGGVVRSGRLTDSDIKAAFMADQMIQASSGFSTVGLAGTLGNTLNKVLLDGFMAVDSVVPFIAAERDVVDFKEVKSYRVESLASFDEVGPSGELKHATLQESAFTNRVRTFGQMLSLTRTMIINDDLGALLDLPRQLGQRAAAKREREVIGTLLALVGSSFYTSANEITGGTSVLSIDSLTAAERKFFEAEDSTGEPVMVKPSVLLVPPALKTLADRIYTSVNLAEIAATNSPERNPHSGKFRPVMSPYLSTTVGLTNGSNTAWHLFSDPRVLAALEVVYLRGKRTPTVESGAHDFNKLGIQWRAVYDFGVAAQTPQATVRSAGA